MSEDDDHRDPMDPPSDEAREALEEDGAVERPPRPQQCDGCQFVTEDLSWWDTRAIFEPAKVGHWLCNLCSKTYMGYALDFPDEYDFKTKAIFQAISFVGNTVLKRIEQIEEGLGATAPDYLVEMGDMMGGPPSGPRPAARGSELRASGVPRAAEAARGPAEPVDPFAGIPRDRYGPPIGEDGGDEAFPAAPKNIKRVIASVELKPEELEPQVDKDGVARDPMLAAGAELFEDDDDWDSDDDLMPSPIGGDAGDSKDMRALSSDPSLARRQAALLAGDEAEELTRKWSEAEGEA